MNSLLSERYEQLRPIGQGAGAQVFSVRDIVTDTKYAMKVAHVALAKHARVRNRWKREISMHARFEHPHIVPLFDYGTMDRGEPYIIMGLAQSAMDSEMKKGISIEQLFLWIEQILQGLSYLHSRNIVHQDFKTENVLINEDGEAWIIDFSIARSLTEIRIHSDEITGTMGWMAPEQLLKLNHYIGPWTDLYAVGKVFELLNHNITNASPISHILESWTHINPYERPTSAADAIADLYRARQNAKRIYEETGEEWLQQHVVVKQLPPPFSIKEQEFLEIIDKSTFTKKELAQDIFEYRMAMFGRKNKMGGYKNPKLFLHRDPILYLWKDMKDQVVEELHKIYTKKSPQGLIFQGDSGSGASELVRSLSTELSACGLMDPVSLRYLKPNGQGGIYEALKEDIFPYGEGIDKILVRVQKQVQRYLGISSELAERQTQALARWCGIVEDKDIDIDSSMGLVFLFKKMAINSNRIGTCLSMFHPERTRVLGDGLHIFSSILNQSVGRRRILILASVNVEDQNSEEYQNNKGEKIYLESFPTEKESGDKEFKEQNRNLSILQRQSLSYIESLGAKKIILEPTFDELKKLLQDYFLLEPDIISDVCAFSKGKIGNVVLLIRFWVAEGYLVYKDSKMVLNIQKSKAFPKNRKQLLLGRLAPVLRGLNKPKIPALTRLMILVSLLKIPPTETLLRQEDNEGLEEALALGLLRQRGRWIEFESEDYRSVILEHAKKFVDLSEYHVRLVSYLRKDTQSSTNSSQYIDIEQRRAIALHWLAAERYDPGISLLCNVAENFFTIGLFQSCMDCAYFCLQFIRQQRTDIQSKSSDVDEIEAMWLPGDGTRQQQIEKVDLYNDNEQQMFMLLARCCLQNREYAQTWTWLRKCTLQTDKLQARALLMQAQLPRFLDHSLDYLRQAESIYRSYNDEVGVAHTQYIRAQIFLEQGAYVQSQLLCQSITDKLSSNRNLWSKAFIALIHSKYRRGEDILKSVNSFIDEARKSGNIFSLSNASYFGAISYMRSRNWQESERIFYVALALASTGGLVRVQAEIFSGLATCKALQGNIQQARQCHQQSYILLKSHNLDEETEVAKIRWLCTFLLDKPFDVFRQHMDRFQPSTTRLVQLWWSLCKMLRHSMITDKQGTDYWWEKSKKNGLFQMWDMNVCFLLQAIVKSSKPHSPNISKLVLQEVQRIYRQNVE